MRLTKIYTVFQILLLGFSIQLYSQTTTVGNGSYTNAFPGTDAAGRNGFPSGTPQLSGNAIGKPVPTNDWWSKLVKENHADNLFNYPMTMKTTNNGLIVTYIPWGPIGDSAPIEVKVTGLATTQTTVSDYSDWTVTMNWKDATHELKATSGIGMPFVYFEKDADDIAEIKVNSGTATINNELLIIENAAAGADFVFYAPVGSTWIKSGNVYTSTLNGKTYWSMAMLPQSISNVSSVAQEYKQYAYVFPTNTVTTWNFNPSTSKVTTNFTITTDVKEGSETEMLLGLLPHHWNNLAPSSPVPTKYTYSSVRGALKTMKGNAFSVENTFKGILPTLPYLSNYSQGFNPADLDAKIASIENDGLSDWTDSYNEGQVMNRLIQTARIADQMGNVTARNKMIATVKQRLENWLSYQSGEKAFLFYYNNTWSALLGYPSGHGQDTNINDHHFHWGYFIHAAAFMEQFEPGWAAQWGDMINLLVRDAASSDRNDDKFPFLRNFSPYAGHSWANGFATFPQGNDQESTSESMQFASSLIHWGRITNNQEITDLGIYIYTTEQTAIEEYWFDMYERNFRQEQNYSLVSRVWGNSYDNGTFWTADIAASYGIEMYPIHGGSLYLGHNVAYATKLWNEITQNTGIIGNQVNPNLWHDTYWKYLSFINPQAAIDMYDAYPDRNLKFGISDAQTYHWLHSMNAMGTVDASITANEPIAAVFVKNGVKTYVAHNYSNAPKTVTFSDGFQLLVPARQMATNRDAAATGEISASFTQAFANGSVDLTVNTTGTGITKVEFFDGTTLLGSTTTAPYQFKAENLTLGIHGMYAKVYVDANFSVTNIVKIQVGEQLPYLDVAFAIPGIIEPGNYDKFEGGIGQNIAYVDGSQNNEGDYRTNEYVDAVNSGAEGKTIGWLSAGEWLEYTIDVATAGKYDLSFRYTSGNSNGGGPFYFEIDGKKISADFSVASTGNWSTWATKVVNNIEFTQGKHILRLVITSGEFNLGKLTFSYAAPLGYSTPVANAGNTVVVILPATTATLDASASSHPENKSLTYAWEQIYGPSVISFTDAAAAATAIGNLEKGIYKCKVTVSDGTYESFSEVLVIVQETSNAVPTVNITSPSNNSSFSQGTAITITASANDLDGSIAKVEFFDGATKLGEDTSSPFSYVWNNASVGNHSLKAVATDNEGATAESQIIAVSVQEVKKCEETSNVAQQGSFSTGYKATFETVGNTVKITFQLLDTNRAGVVAYLWKQSPFGEVQMDNVSGLIFTKTISGVADGETISYACKFAFAGGLAVTKYISYKVGTSCSTLGIDDQVLQKEITLYPNPATNLVHIQSNTTEILKVAVYNTLGSLVKTTYKSAAINIESLAKGVYLTKITTDKGVVMKRLIKN
ncbi:glycosyl hydrolase [Polaribacter gangjinensis]|uniref:glucan endo-1,3-beta-D-glucosidase n=1 Tax=Polaribacter gangjinensis TaxID=574710 RepID=A0A2S7WA37_9FLAO|nr:glycosyl hydrolase [Polaribacter gangjinensis]PQJ74276.1 endo-1,3(4)-beta-glucanase [Polaribacter gangjinensis]